MDKGPKHCQRFRKSGVHAIQTRVKFKRRERHRAVAFGCLLALAGGQGNLAQAATVAGSAGLSEAIAVADHPFRTFGRSITATFYAKATSHQTFTVLSDHWHMAEYMPLVEDVTVLDQQPGRARVRFHLRYLKIFDFYEVDERIFTLDRRITWHAVEGPLKVSDGSWTFTAVGPRTRIVYQTDVDPGIPIPSRLTGEMVKDGLVAFLTAVRQRIESQGTWRKRVTLAPR
jgi:ribosome-associated toxin RatA of RatAB toxin-antitoxin module